MLRRQDLLRGLSEHVQFNRSGVSSVPIVSTVIPPIVRPVGVIVILSRHIRCEMIILSGLKVLGIFSVVSSEGGSLCVIFISAV